MRILLVEDNADLAASIADFLEIKGHVCDLSFNGEAGLINAKNNQYDMYVFDVSMPKMDGLTLCRLLRTEHQDTTPVLFLTARDTLDDKLAGFSAGADDYLVKPFDLSELYARLNAIHIRHKGISKQLKLDDLVVDMDAEEVTVSDQKIVLSPNSFKLLVVLLQRSPNLVLREELEYLVWGEDVPDSDSLRSHIYKLRNKIDKPFNRSMIKTVKGRGFSIS